MDPGGGSKPPPYDVDWQNRNRPTHSIPLPLNTHPLHTPPQMGLGSTISSSYPFKPASISLLYWLRAMVLDGKRFFKAPFRGEGQGKNLYSLLPQSDVIFLPILATRNTTPQYRHPYLYFGYAQQFLMGIDFLRQIATLPLGMPKGPIPHNGSSQ